MYCLNPINKIECLSPYIGGHKGVKIQKSNFETPNFEKKSIIYSTISIWVSFLLQLNKDCHHDNSFN